MTPHQAFIDKTRVNGKKAGWEYEFKLPGGTKFGISQSELFYKKIKKRYEPFLIRMVHLIIFMMPT